MIKNETKREKKQEEYKNVYLHEITIIPMIVRKYPINFCL